MAAIASTTVNNGYHSSRIGAHHAAADQPRWIIQRMKDTARQFDHQHFTTDKLI
jgi:hypothetical protein